MIAIAVGSIAAQSRMVRSAVLTVKNNEYVEAAMAMGANDMQIIFYHIIPNCVGTIIVQFSVKIAGGILSASSLSFLGLGVQPPDPEWGAMLSGGRTYMLDNPTLTLFPGLCIMIVILALNMLGDGLRDSLDPRLKG
jgi:peptide/nickel transport system permease protein